MTTQVRRIVRGQVVAREKVKLARQFRRDATVEEATLWLVFRGNRLAGLHFRRQQVIAGFIMDFYCHTPRLVVEVDGAVHHDPEVASKDEHRDKALNDLGLNVLRIPADDVQNDIQSALRRVEQEALRLR